MERENILQTKSYDFAKQIILTYKHLVSEQKEYTLGKQLLRSGTSIGANIEEAIGGYSKKDFLAKMSIAYKEVRETKYWLRLLHDTGFLNTTDFESLFSKAEELAKILFSIIRSGRQQT
jgi:four helix bundle protein